MEQRQKSNIRAIHSKHTEAVLAFIRENEILNMPYTNQEMVDLTNTSRSAISKKITDLKERGIIQERPRYIITPPYEKIVDQLLLERQSRRKSNQSDK